MGFKLPSTDPLTSQIKSLNLNTWEDLMNYIQSLPYGRNANRHDFSLVLKEKKGTCSSKHALLREVAALNDVPNVRLIIGMYKMSEHNTPNIGDGLSKSGLDYIPEAHCYLMIDKKRIDLTTNNSEFLKIEKDLLTEVEIQPHQVSTYKVEFHQDYLKDWIMKNKGSFSFNEVWGIRERCIAHLSEIRGIR